MISYVIDPPVPEPLKPPSAGRVPPGNVLPGNVLPIGVTPVKVEVTRNSPVEVCYCRKRKHYVERLRARHHQSRLVNISFFVNCEIQSRIERYRLTQKVLARVNRQV